MTMSSAELKVGMKVVGSDGYDVGDIREVRDSDFLVNMKFAKDAYVPREAVQEVAEDKVVLRVPAAEAYRHHWQPIS